MKINKVKDGIYPAKITSVYIASKKKVIFDLEIKVKRKKKVEGQEGIDATTLPKDAARLTRALILIKDELNSVYGIEVKQKRSKERLYVIKNKNLIEDTEEV